MWSRWDGDQVTARSIFAVECVDEVGQNVCSASLDIKYQIKLSKPKILVFVG